MKSIILGVILLFVLLLVHASEGGDDILQETVVDVSTGDLNAGDVITGDNQTITVVAPGLGDVDIAQCLGSTQWTLLIGGKQKLELNQVCMAEFYLKQGRYDLAAQALCNQPEILKEYATETECEDGHDFTPNQPPEPDDLYSQSVKFDEHYELAQQQEQEIEYLQEEQASLVSRIDDLTEQIEQVPRYSVPTATEPVEQYTDEQFDAVWSVLKGETEDE